MKVNTSATPNATEVKTNLFNGGITIDQGADGRVEISGQMNLSPAGKEFLATAFAAAVNYITGKDCQKAIDCDDEE